MMMMMTIPGGDNFCFLKTSGLNKSKISSNNVPGAEVVPPGIEPGTPGFSVLCSTN